jgi:hypothetical protein
MKTSEVPLDPPEARINRFADALLESRIGYQRAETDTAVILRCSPYWASLEG